MNLTPLLSHKLKISAAIKYQVGLNGPQSPAGRAPTGANRNCRSPPSGRNYYAQRAMSQFGTAVTGHLFHNLPASIGCPTVILCEVVGNLMPPGFGACELMISRRAGWIAVNCTHTQVQDLRFGVGFDQYVRPTFRTKHPVVFLGRCV
jgi:hypothetical protein